MCALAREPKWSGKPARREQALSVALELFSRQGFEKTSLRQIAERLGISQAALYYHFPAKDDLLCALVTPLLDRVEQLLGEAPAELGTPAERLSFLEGYLEALLAHPGAVGLLGNDPSVLSHPRFGERVNDLNERLLSRLAGPEPGLPARLRAACALVGIQGAAVRFAGTDAATVRRVGLAAAAAALESGRSEG